MCNPDYEWQLEGGSCGRCTGMAGSGHASAPGRLHPNCRCKIKITDCNDRIESENIDISFHGGTVFILFEAIICCWDGTEKNIGKVYEFTIEEYIVDEQEISLDMFADLMDAGINHVGFCPPCSGANIA